ncbi:hypothetical protein NQZ68_031228 [Dissostichus eleginoides]|nr:hypothetical protein NQZ68_031228 [Dissostichus eleginoides]
MCVREDECICALYNNVHVDTLQIKPQDSSTVWPSHFQTAVCVHMFRRLHCGRGAKTDPDIPDSPPGETGLLLDGPLLCGGGLQYLSHCTFYVQHCRATVEQMPQVGGGGGAEASGHVSPQVELSSSSRAEEEEEQSRSAAAADTHSMTHYTLQSTHANQQ